ncbi:MAG: BA14K family protein [Xanthobacteraceae bacterium]
MTDQMKRLVAAMVLAAGIGSAATAASATPVADALAIRNAVPAQVESVQWRRGWGGGGGWRRGGGWGGVGAGFVAGAILGGALAAPYYAPGPYYAAPPPVYYAPPAPAYGPPVADAEAYCMQRFKSYDPATGTYLGYDGLRHPCP